MSKQTIPFIALTAQEQRAEIGKYVTAFPYQAGLIGEALGEHGFAQGIREAFIAGNHMGFATLCDIAIREYLGIIIEQDTDWRIEA